MRPWPPPAACFVPSIATDDSADSSKALPRPAPRRVGSCRGTNSGEGRHDVVDALLSRHHFGPSGVHLRSAAAQRSRSPPGRPPSNRRQHLHRLHLWCGLCASTMWPLQRLRKHCIRLCNRVLPWHSEHVTIDVVVSGYCLQEVECELLLGKDRSQRRQLQASRVSGGRRRRATLRAPHTEATSANLWVLGILRLSVCV